MTVPARRRWRCADGRLTPAWSRRRIHWDRPVEGPTSGEVRAPRLYALLVGIDEYPASITSLRGCVNDIEDVYVYLTDAVRFQAHVRKLLNREATCSAVIDGFRRHLSQAGPGDTALFWYCGYGSTLAVPPGWWEVEPNGTTMQTLVCADSRGVGKPHDLLDKHLAILIREVTSRGAHVAVVLDCCHSGGAGRALPPSAAVRQLEPASELPSPAHLSLTMLSRRADHVALAACERDQLAHELPDEYGKHRGVFSRGVLAELRRTGANLTYRDLVSSARGYVENLVEAQTPSLYPADKSIVDKPFLDGLTFLPSQP
jgi:hypothetical protein